MKIKELKPFVFVGLLWLIGGIAYSPSAIKWTAGLWILCLLDLFFTAKAISAVSVLMVEQSNQNKPARMVQAAFWGFLKVAALGVLIGSIYFGKSAPSESLVIGLGTLVIVPLVGGFWWSQKELKHA